MRDEGTGVREYVQIHVQDGSSSKSVDGLDGGRSRRCFDDKT